MVDGEMSKNNDSEDAPAVLGAEEQAVLRRVSSGEWAKYARVAMAALSALPWVGSVIGAAAELTSENAQESTDRAMYMWLKAHEEKLREILATLQDVFSRFESFGQGIEERVNSEEYMSLVRKTFTQWDHAETSEKKDMLRKLITNAGGLDVAKDDLVRMFLDWIDSYHEFHFAVIGEIYRNSGITRRRMWANLRGSFPREDSDEADLFKLLIRDLSTGGVIRQERHVDYSGQFVKQPRGRGGSQNSGVLESAFESTKGYELTALGSQFVHYVMTDLATPLGG
jgi:hypothetical protein